VCGVFRRVEGKEGVSRKWARAGTVPVALIHWQTRVKMQQDAVIQCMCGKWKLL